MVNEGDKAPDFNLKGNDNKSYSLKNFKGKTLVLYFYPKDDTPGCTKEACNFSSSLEDFEKKNATVVGVSVDDLESHGKFTKKYNLKILLLSDLEKKTVQDYSVWKEKSMYGKKYYGIERTTFIIDGKGIVKKVFSKVNPDGHEKQILAEI